MGDFIGWDKSILNSTRTQFKAHSTLWSGQQWLAAQ
jgi:hypothetical protein